jgi:hypothetical protein
MKPGAVRLPEAELERWASLYGILLTIEEVAHLDCAGKLGVDFKPEPFYEQCGEHLRELKAIAPDFEHVLKFCAQCKLTLLYGDTVVKEQLASADLLATMREDEGQVGKLFDTVKKGCMAGAPPERILQFLRQIWGILDKRGMFRDPKIKEISQKWVTRFSAKPVAATVREDLLKEIDTWYDLVKSLRLR